MAIAVDRSATTRRTTRSRHIARLSATAGMTACGLLGLGLLAQGSVLFGAASLLAASTLWQASLLGRRARRHASAVRHPAP